MKKNERLNLRKLLLLLTVAALMLCLAACKDKPSDLSDETVPPTDSVQVDPTTGATDAPTLPQVPDETAPEVVMGTVSADNLNVRSNPSTDSTVLKQLDINTRVVIIEQRQVGDTNWGRIQEGWINLSYVLLDGQEPTEPEETKAPETEDIPGTGSETDSITGTVTASELNIRKSANADSESVGKYRKGDKIEILESKNGWGRTNKGWVSLKYVNTSGKIETEDVPKDDENKTDDKELKTLVTNGKTTVLGHVVVDIGSLNVRYGPGTKYAKCDTVTRGERLAYYQEKNGWVRTKTGWISLAYTEKDEPLSEKEATTLVTDGKTAVLGTVTVKVESLNVRYGPSTKYNKVKSVEEGDKFDYYQQKDGWVRIKDGWISMTYTDKKDDAKKEETTSKELVTDKNTAILGYVTVDAEALNVRYGPGTKYGVCGEVEKGDKEAYYQKEGNWVRTEKGWISTKYAKVDNAAVTYKTGKGTITASSLKIRESGSLDAKQVGSYEKGDKVEILEVKGEWGKTDKGWINLKYVKMS